MDWDGVEDEVDALPPVPNPDCLNRYRCNCVLTPVSEDDDQSCEEQGLVDCIDPDGTEYCGNAGDEGCGEGVWCTTGYGSCCGDPDDDEVECCLPYWDENGSCASCNDGSFCEGD